MRIRYFFHSFLFLLAISFFVLALLTVPSVGMVLKAILLSLAGSILFAFIYPEWRGIKKGDMVRISKPMIPEIFWPQGVSLMDGKKKETIRVQVGNREIVGVVESYMGWLTNPTIRPLYEEVEQGVSFKRRDY